jgi:hypothetical protein
MQLQIRQPLRGWFSDTITETEPASTLADAPSRDIVMFKESFQIHEPHSIELKFVWDFLK